MKILLIFFFILISSYSNGSELELSCNFINNSKIKYTEISYHYQCSLDHVLYEKIEVIPWDQFAISKIHLYKKLDFNKKEFNILAFKSILGRTISYRHKKNLNEKVYYVHEEKDSNGNLTKIIIYATLTKNSKIFIKNDDIDSQFFENNFLNEIKIIPKKEFNDYETVITENIINYNDLINDEIFEIPNSTNQINDNEQIDDPRDSSLLILN